MSDIGRTFGMLLRGITTESVALVQGTVKAVNREDKTADVEIGRGHIVTGVTLDTVTGGGSGVIVFPAVESVVMVGFVENRPELPYIAQCTKADEIAITVGATTINVTDGLININSGAKGGMVLINELTAKLNDLVSAFNSHTHTVSTTGTAAAQTGTAAATTGTASNFSAGDYENTKIKQ